MSKKNKQACYVHMASEDYQRKGYSWLQKVICSFVLGFSRNNKKFFASPQWIAEILGTTNKTVYKTFSKMRDDGIFPGAAADAKKMTETDSLDGESDSPGGEDNSRDGEQDSLGGECLSPHGEIKSGEMPLKTSSLYASRYPSLKTNLKASGTCKPEPASEAAQANAAPGAEVEETDVGEMAKRTAIVNSASGAKDEAVAEEISQSGSASFAVKTKAKEGVSAFDKLVADFVEAKAAPTSTLSSAQANAASSDKRSQGRTDPLPAAQNVTTSKQTPKATALGDDDDGYFTASNADGKIVRFPKMRKVADGGSPVSATLAKAGTQLLIKKSPEQLEAEFDAVFRDESARV